MKYFGHKCEYFNGVWDVPPDEDQYKMQDFEPEICFCNHEMNDSDFEGNCNYNECPLNLPNVLHALKCFKCDHIIYSRANHDFRYCKCKSIGIDGGQNNYSIRVIFKDYSKYKSIKHLVDASYNDLYDDWLNKGNVFGIEEVEK